jgi:hypothetical protein
MGIYYSITRSCKQTAVYWGNPQNDGEGGFTFDLPIEILCRWEDVNVTFEEPNGNISHAKSSVYVLQDVDQEGRLYLGTLDDLLSSAGESTGELDPIKIDGAYIIKRFDKKPALGSTTEFLRKVYVTTKRVM